MATSAAAQSPVCVPETECRAAEDFTTRVIRDAPCAKLGITKSSFSGYQIATSSAAEMTLSDMTVMFPKEDLPSRFNKGATTLTFPQLNVPPNVVVDFMFEVEMEWQKSNTTTLKQSRGVRTVYGSDARPVKVGFRHNGVYQVIGLTVQDLSCHFIAIEERT